MNPPKELQANVKQVRLSVPQTCSDRLLSHRTDLGVNSLHRSVPVGLGLGDPVSVGCLVSNP